MSSKDQCSTARIMMHKEEKEEPTSDQTRAAMMWTDTEGPALSRNA